MRYSSASARNQEIHYNIFLLSQVATDYSMGVSFQQVHKLACQGHQVKLVIALGLEEPSPPGHPHSHSSACRMMPVEGCTSRHIPTSWRPRRAGAGHACPVTAVWLSPTVGGPARTNPARA